MGGGFGHMRNRTATGNDHIKIEIFKVLKTLAKVYAYQKDEYAQRGRTLTWR